MFSLDVASKTVAVVSAIIATLRAGSRAAYLFDYDTIGRMEGPSIRETNQTESVFQLSRAFQHCISLSMDPQPYQDMTISTSSIASEMIPTQVGFNQEFEMGRLDQEEWGPWSLIFNLDKRKHTSTDQNSSPQYSESGQKRPARYEFLQSLWNPLCRAWKRRRRYAPQAWDWGLSTKAKLKATQSPPGQTDTSSGRVTHMEVFSPETFRYMRNNLFHVSEESYQQSMLRSGPFVSFQSNSKGAARTGGVFFFSRDGAYLIKTIKKEEAESLLRMLPKYQMHMERYGRTSLLARLCGLYSVQIQDDKKSKEGRVHTFLVMNALHPAESSRFISERFDLKGATVGREVSQEELLTKGKNVVLKDLDLAREVELVRSMGGAMASSGYGLSLGRSKESLMAQLREDVRLLVDCQVMDYSLLVGVVNMEVGMTFDRSTRRAIAAIQDQGLPLQPNHGGTLGSARQALNLLRSSPRNLAGYLWLLRQRMCSPLNYYGSEKCLVNGGSLSVLQGTRNGDRALYYFGVIDYLQPWTSRKVWERKLKGAIGYNTSAISCVTPEEYGIRFLNFAENHLT